MMTRGPFSTRGALSGPAYIERAADRSLRHEIDAGTSFPCIVAPPRTGKSSLLLHTHHILREQYQCATLDLSRFSTQAHDHFWDAALRAVAASADLPLDVINPVQPVSTFSAWLGTMPARLIVFIDEGDSTLTSLFCEEFLDTIQELHRRRSEDSALARLTLVLAGTALTHHITSRPSSSSPFVEIPIDDLSFVETKKLASLLSASEDDSVSACLYCVTRGSVFLCQLLLERLWVVQHSAPAGITDLDRVLDDLVNSASREPHFVEIYAEFLDDGWLRKSFSDLIMGRQVPETAAQALSLTGISDRATPFRNPLYRRIFDRGGPLDLIALLNSIRPLSREFAIEAVFRDTFSEHNRPNPLISRYRVERRLGVGGMSEVFLAQDPTLRRQVAIKVMKRSCPAGEECALLREGWALASITHPAVVSVYDVGVDHGRAFIVLEYVEGVTLDTWVNSDRRTLTDVLRVLIPVCEGLARAHEHGVVHFDLKPQNILVCSDGRAKVIDFGLVAVDALDEPSSSGAGSEGVITGTLAYLPPERVSENYNGDCRSDIFSMGIVIYEAVFGERPFKGRGLAVVRSIAEDLPRTPILRGLQARILWRVVQRALAKDPNSRYMTMQLLGDALRSVVALPRRLLVLLVSALVVVVTLSIVIASS